MIVDRNGARRQLKKEEYTMREHNLSFIYEVLGFERCTRAIYPLGELLLVIDDGLTRSVVNSEEALDWCRDNEESESDERYNDFCQSVDSIHNGNGQMPRKEVREGLKALIGHCNKVYEQEVMEILFSGADADDLERVNDEGWVVYHEKEAGYPDSRERGPWFYKTEDFDGPGTYSSGYGTEAEAVEACLSEIEDPGEI